jgi:hypothetical protein
MRRIGHVARIGDLKIHPILSEYLTGRYDLGALNVATEEDATKIGSDDLDWILLVKNGDQ